MQNMLTVARLMIAAAQVREESRGVHTRSDFPKPDPTWARHLSLSRPIEIENEALQGPITDKADVDERGDS
jgi:L-aspartate oxidase